MDRLTVPLPASVTAPEICRSVKLPADWMLTVPLLVTVPCSVRKELFTTLKVPVLARLASVAVWPPTVVNWPVSNVASVPPERVAPPVTVTTPPLMALSVPAADCPNVVLPATTTLPPSARTSPLFSTVPVLEKVNALDTLPSMVPLLVKLKFVPAPICPAPCRVWPAPRIKLSPALTPRIRFCPALESVIVPVPRMLRLPSERRSVKLPTDCRFTVPLLVSVPLKSRNALLLTLTVPVLLTPATRAVLPPITTTCPPDAVLNVPPLT